MKTFTNPSAIQGAVYCQETNLVAYTSEKACKEFIESICATAHAVWKCAACEQWHFVALPKDTGNEKSFRLNAWKQKRGIE